MAYIPLSIEVLPIDKPLINPLFVGCYITRKIRGFPLAVDSSWTFKQVYEHALDAYRYLYNEGKACDWRFASITTAAPYLDIDTRYTVEQWCADGRAPSFVIHTAPHNHSLPLPPDPTLSLPLPPLPPKRTFQDTQQPDEAGAASDLKKKKKRRTAARDTSATALDPVQPSLSEVNHDTQHSSDHIEASQSLPQDHETAEPTPAQTSAVPTSQSMPSQPSQKSTSSGRTTYSVVFSPNDLENMRVSARHGVFTPDLWSRYYLGLDFESVVKQYAIIRREVKEERKREQEEKARQDRIRAEDASGNRSSSADEVYTRIENCLLAAARLEGADMARIAKKHFPRRAVQAVVTRGKNIYHEIERLVQRDLPGAKIDRESILVAVGPERSDCINAQRLVARESMREFAADRQAEVRAEEEENERIEAARGRRFLHTQNLNDIQANARARESRAKSREDLAQRRANEDARNQRKYQRDLADWEARVAKARKTHQRLPPRPKAPAASTIGLEIASSQDLQRLTGSSHATLDGWVDRTNRRPNIGRARAVAGPSTATANSTVNSQTRKSGGLPTPKKSPRNSNPAQSSDDASVVSVNLADFTNAQALKVLREDQPSTATNSQARSKPAKASRSKTTRTQARPKVNAQSSRASRKNNHEVIVVDHEVIVVDPEPATAESSRSSRQNNQEVIVVDPEPATATSKQNNHEVIVVEPEQATATTKAPQAKQASGANQATATTKAPAPAQASTSQSKPATATNKVPAPEPATVPNKAPAPEEASASAPKLATATTKAPAQEQASAPAPKRVSTTTKATPTVQSKPQKSVAFKTTPVAIAGPSGTSKKTAAIPATSQTQLRASQTEPVWQPYDQATQGRFVDLSSSEDGGDSDESGSDYDLSLMHEAAQRQRAAQLLKNQEAMREHDARSKERYQSMLGRMRAAEEARRPTGNPHPVLTNASGDTESADEEICRFLDTGLTEPAEDTIKGGPSAPVGSYQPLRRQATAAPKWSQSTLGSARPPFPSSGKVRSASPSDDKSKEKENENENGFSAEDEYEEEDERREITLEELRAYHDRVEKVRRWLRTVEPANVDEVGGLMAAT
ncbi:hypothetical protein MBLNU457_3650t2 [Dothideomycetes sp. NU457]